MACVTDWNNTADSPSQPAGCLCSCRHLEVLLWAVVDIVCSVLRLAPAKDSLAGDRLDVANGFLSAFIATYASGGDRDTLQRASGANELVAHFALVRRAWTWP